MESLRSAKDRSHDYQPGDHSEEESREGETKARRRSELRSESRKSKPSKQFSVKFEVQDGASQDGAKLWNETGEVNIAAVLNHRRGSQIKTGEWTSEEHEPASSPHEANREAGEAEEATLERDQLRLLYLCARLTQIIDAAPPWQPEKPKEGSSSKGKKPRTRRKSVKHDAVKQLQATANMFDNREVQPLRTASGRTLLEPLAKLEDVAGLDSEPVRGGPRRAGSCTPGGPGDADAEKVQGKSVLDTKGTGNERWLRRLPLLVYMYEAVLNQLLDYDFAPAMEFNGSQMISMNVSREGDDDLNDLQAAGLLLSLKLATKEHFHVTAYQVSEEGLGALAGCSLRDRQEVDYFLTHCLTLNASDSNRVQIDPDLALLTGDQAGVGVKHGAIFDVKLQAADNTFSLLMGTKFRKSTVTDMEDVSYVVSPFLPQALRTSAVPTSSYKHRIEESAAGWNLRDNELNYSVYLSKVRILSSEYLPNGPNNLMALREKVGNDIGSHKNNLITAHVDKQPEGVSFKLGLRGLSAISALEYSMSESMNLEAQVFLPEDPGIVQLENLGIHVHADGQCYVGCEVDGVMGQAEHVPVDLLCRLVNDIHEDSRHILDNLMSIHQRCLVKCLFKSTHYIRYSFNQTICFLAEDITPRLPARDYMDGEILESDLAQILGDLVSAHDLPGEVVLLVGKNGTLLAGPNVTQLDHCMLPFLAVMARLTFIGNFFHRLFILEDRLATIRTLIDEHYGRPQSLTTIRHEVMNVSRDVTLLRAFLKSFTESLQKFDLRAAGGEAAAHPGAEALRGLLQSEVYLRDARRRSDDLVKLLECLELEVAAMQDNTDVISEAQMFALQESVQTNTRNMETLFRANQSASSSLEIMQLILGGTLAFSILDRVTGDFTMVWAGEWGEWLFDNVVYQPGVWFAISIVSFISMGLVLRYTMNRLLAISAAHLSLHHDLDIPVDLQTLAEYLSSKQVVSQDIDAEPGGRCLRRIMWVEQGPGWGGSALEVNMSVDEQHASVIHVHLLYNMVQGTLNAQEIQRRFFQDLAVGTDNANNKHLQQLAGAGKKKKSPVSGPSFDRHVSFSERSHIDEQDRTLPPSGNTREGTSGKGWQILGSNSGGMFDRLAKASGSFPRVSGKKVLTKSFSFFEDTVERLDQKKREQRQKKAVWTEDGHSN